MKREMQCLSIERHDVDFLQCVLYKVNERLYVYEVIGKSVTYQEIGYLSGNEGFPHLNGFL